MNANTSLMYDALHAAAGSALRAWMDAHHAAVERAGRYIEAIEDVVDSIYENIANTLKDDPAYFESPEDAVAGHSGIAEELWGEQLRNANLDRDLYPFRQAWPAIYALALASSHYAFENARLRRAAAPAAAPTAGTGLGAFDWFSTTGETAPAVAADFRQTARDDFRAVVGVEPTVFPASEVMREREDAIESLAYYTTPYMRGVREAAWLVFAPDATATTAETIGKRVLRNMLPRTKVGASSPLLLGHTLYVAFPGGMVAVAPPEKKQTTRTGPTLTEQKDEILAMLAPFGRGVSLRGSEEEGYILSISPTLRAHKFRTYTTPTRPLASVREAARELVARLARTGGDVNAVMRGEGRG